MSADPVCLTPWDSQGNQIWDAINGTTFTCLRGQGGGGYQASYVFCETVRSDALMENSVTMWDGTDICPTLTLNNANGGQRMPDKENFNAVIETRATRRVLRRLTPLEVLRLQGLPDWWVDGVDGSNSSVYRMAGNGIAIPCAADIMRKLAECLEENKKEESTK